MGSEERGRFAVWPQFGPKPAVDHSLLTGNGVPNPAGQTIGKRTFNVELCGIQPRRNLSGHILPARNPT
jgi:hypothetical protein